MANDGGVTPARGRSVSALQIRPNNGIAPSGPNSPASSIFSTESKALGRRNTKSIQDRFYSKILEQVATAQESDEELEDEEVDLYPDEEIKEKVKHASRGFSLPSLDLNLMRLNARIGALFEQQEYTVGIFTWAKPVHTLSFLAIHTLIWLNPHLIPGLPLLQACYMIIMPAFLARHPRQTNDTRMAPINFGPPTAPPPYLKSTPLHRDFRRNMRDLQHSMENMNKAHEDMNKYVVPQFNFSDEAVTSEIFIANFFSAIFVFLTAHLLHWPTVFLVGGWVGIIAGHPAVKEVLSTPEGAAKSKQRLHDLLEAVRTFVHDDIVLDEAPEVRQVEVFELQRHKPGDDESWEAWLYSPTPYDPLSPERIAGARPRGTQFFEEVMPPAGWKWKEKKWSMDHSSTEWIQQRMISGVEVETEGEMWVYDIPAEDEEEYLSAVAASTTVDQDKARGLARSGWEEASGIEKRGEWRRRRWTRDVEGKHMRTGQ